jgi:hypothetical protein
MAARLQGQGVCLLGVALSGGLTMRSSGPRGMKFLVQSSVAARTAA